MTRASRVSQHQNHIVTANFPFVAFQLGDYLLRIPADEPIRGHAIKCPLGVGCDLFDPRLPLRIKASGREEAEIQVEQMIGLDVRPPDLLDVGAAFTDPGVAEKRNLNARIACSNRCSPIDLTPGFHDGKIM